MGLIALKLGILDCCGSMLYSFLQAGHSVDVEMSKFDSVAVEAFWAVVSSESEDSTWLFFESTSWWLSCFCLIYSRILPHIKGNVGFVFTRGELTEVRERLLQNKVRAPARAGAVAPCPVIIPSQNTGLGPEKTSFFQALSIPTKISKGTIEIIVREGFCLISINHINHINRTAVDCSGVTALLLLCKTCQSLWFYE